MRSFTWQLRHHAAVKLMNTGRPAARAAWSACSEYGCHATSRSRFAAARRTLRHCVRRTLPSLRRAHRIRMASQLRQRYRQSQRNQHHRRNRAAPLRRPPSQRPPCNRNQQKARQQQRNLRHAAVASCARGFDLSINPRQQDRARRRAAPPSVASAPPSTRRGFRQQPRPRRALPAQQHIRRSQPGAERGEYRKGQSCRLRQRKADRRAHKRGRARRRHPTVASTPVKSCPHILASRQILSAHAGQRQLNVELPRQRQRQKEQQRRQHRKKRPATAVGIPTPHRRCRPRAALAAPPRSPRTTPGSPAYTPAHARSRCCRSRSAPALAVCPPAVWANASPF